MKIKSVSQVKNRTGSFSVLFDDGSEIKVSAVQLADFGLYSGLELSDNEYAQLRKGVESSLSKSRAVRILGSRNLSAFEIERRLIGKGEPESTARETVEWLENIGAVNDAEYAAAIVKHYCAKGYGLARIRDELFRRGIPRDLWEDAFDEVDGMEEAAYRFLVNKMKGSRDKDSIRRAMDALIRRGFSYEQARSAMNMYVENLGNIEES